MHALHLFLELARYISGHLKTIGFSARITFENGTGHLDLLALWVWATSQWSGLDPRKSYYVGLKVAHVLMYIYSLGLYS